MEIKNILAFIKVAEFNNFTRAAESLGYSQAAVTARIKSLENELGVFLFDRIGKRIRLTQEGKAFLPHAYNIVKAESEALNSVRSINELTGELRICAGSSYAMAVLPDILLKFKEKHPKVNVIVKISDYLEDTILKLSRGEIDFLVCMDDVNSYPEFVKMAVCQEPVIFVTYPSNPILNIENVSIEDIMSRQYITSDRNIGYCALLEKEINKLGIKVEPVMEIGSVAAIIDMIIKGYGISYIPEFIAEKHLKNGELVEINAPKININMSSYYLCSKYRWINPVMKEFINEVEKQRSEI